MVYTAWFIQTGSRLSSIRRKVLPVILWRLLYLIYHCSIIITLTPLLDLGPWVATATIHNIQIHIFDLAVK